MFPETGRVKKIYYSPARIAECESEYIFLKTNKQKKQTSKAKQEYKKAKETKEKKRISAEHRLKKQISCRPGEDFSTRSSQLHFRKQEGVFFGLIVLCCTALDSLIQVNKVRLECGVT